MCLPWNFNCIIVLKTCHWLLCFIIYINLLSLTYYSVFLYCPVIHFLQSFGLLICFRGPEKYLLISKWYPALYLNLLLLSSFFLMCLNTHFISCAFLPRTLWNISNQMSQRAGKQTHTAALCRLQQRLSDLERRLRRWKTGLWRNVCIICLLFSWLSGFVLMEVVQHSLRGAADCSFMLQQQQQVSAQVGFLRYCEPRGGIYHPINTRSQTESPDKPLNPSQFLKVALCRKNK